jgi:hypothetical protein
MDSSNRLQLIKEGFDVHSDDLTPQEWVEILKLILTRARPNLKYLGPKPLSDILNGKYKNSDGPPNYSKREMITPRELIRCPEDIFLTMRFTELHEERTWITKAPPYKQDRRALLLSEQGKFIEWKGAYELKEGGNPSVSLTETASSCCLTELNDETLANYLSITWDKKKTGPKILTRLDKFWGSIHLEREIRTRNVGKIHNLVRRLRSQIQ